MKFEERMLTQKLSPEWIKHATSAPQDQIKQRLEDAVGKVERNYNAVAQVGESETFGGTSYRVQIIYAKDADEQEMRRALKSVMHWVVEDDL